MLGPNHYFYHCTAFSIGIRGHRWKMNVVLQWFNPQHWMILQACSWLSPKSGDALQIWALIWGKISLLLEFVHREQGWRALPLCMHTPGESCASACMVMALQSMSQAPAVCAGCCVPRILQSQSRTCRARAGVDCCGDQNMVVMGQPRWHWDGQSMSPGVAACSFCAIVFRAGFTIWPVKSGDINREYGF